jgi:hypothetical protein
VLGVHNCAQGGGMCWEKDWYMCSRMCICVQDSGICARGLVYVFTDVHMCSRIGMCARGLVYVFTDVHNCAQGGGMCWEKDWYMCSMMCIIVLKDWYMCSRMCICVQDSGMCWEKEWYVFTDVHMCSR